MLVVGFLVLQATPAQRGPAQRCPAPMLTVHKKGISIDAALLSSLEVEVLSEDEMDALTSATLYHPGAADAGTLAQVTDDSLANAYGDTLNFFSILVNERRGDPVDATVEEKLLTLRQLQSELEDVISVGLLSPDRQRWLADKADLVARQMNIKAEWQALKARQQRAMLAWGQLSEKVEATSSASPASTSALVVAEEWPLSKVLSKTSLKEQVALVREHADLSQKQVLLDAEDERLMVEALELYQMEQPDRERRERIVRQQEAILIDLERLLEDKGTFSGHATFGENNGFVQGNLY